jgi:hypothetical protein
MKTIIVLVFLLIGLSCLQAQDFNDEPLTGKKGQVILPQKGDIGVGVNLIPFFYWMGNSFNANADNTYASDDKFFNIFGNSVIIGKYLLTDNSALRLAWGVNMGNATKEEYVQDDASNDPNIMVKDSRTLNWSRASLALGYEMRKGKRRLQGFWGVDLRVSYNKNSDYTYSYGNGYSLSNLVPTAYNWGSNLNTNKRTLSHTGSNVWGVGLRGFVGVEYYIAPKVCIGAEFGWGVMYQHTLATTISEEYYNPTSQEVALENNYVAASNRVSAGVDNFDGTVYLMFFFNSGGGTGSTTKNVKKGTKKEKPAKKKVEKKSRKRVTGNSRF